MNIIYIVIRATASILALLVITRLLGKRQISQMSFFDYVTGITIGSIAAVLACDDGLEWYKPAVALVVFAAVSLSISLGTDKSIRLRRLLNGSPTILIYKGTILTDNLTKVKLDVNDLQMECRTQGYFHIEDVYFAVMEANGRVSIQPRAAAAPPDASDMGIPAVQTSLQSNVIMSGRVMPRNLAAAGWDTARLYTELRAQGYADARRVFLAVLNEDGRLTVYPARIDGDEKYATVLE